MSRFNSKASNAPDKKVDGVVNAKDSSLRLLHDNVAEFICPSGIVAR